MTFSPACRPLVTVSCWPVPRTTSTRRISTLLALSTTSTKAPLWSIWMACCGISQRGLRLADLGDHGDELAVHENAVGIGEHRANLHGVGSLVDRHIDEIDLAGMRVSAAVGKPDVDDRVHRIGLPLLADLEHLALRDGEGHVDGVLPDDGRQRAGRGSDEVADRNRCPSDPTRQRSANFGVAELQLRLLQRSLLARQLASSIALLSGHHIQSLLRARLTLDKGGLPLDLYVCELQRRLRLLNAGIDLVDGGLVGRLLDDEQQVALLDVLAFVEQALLEEALHTRAQLHLVLRLHAPGEGQGRPDLILGDGDDGNRRRRRLGGGFLAAIVAGCQKQHQRKAQSTPRMRAISAPTDVSEHRPHPIAPGKPMKWSPRNRRSSSRQWTARDIGEYPYDDQGISLSIVCICIPRHALVAAHAPEAIALGTQRQRQSAFVLNATREFPDKTVGGPLAT